MDPNLQESTHLYHNRNRTAICDAERIDVGRVILMFQVAKQQFGCGIMGLAQELSSRGHFPNLVLNHLGETLGIGLRQKLLAVFLPTVEPPAFVRRGHEGVNKQVGVETREGAAVIRSDFAINANIWA